TGAGGTPAGDHPGSDFGIDGVCQARVQTRPGKEKRMNVETQLSAGIAALGLVLPDGAEAKLLAYLALLDKWNRVYNLTAVRDAERMVSHHLLDSLAAVPIFDEVLRAASPSPQLSPLKGEG